MGRQEAFLGDTDRRTLEILKMLRDKACDEAMAKDGATLTDYWKPFGVPTGPCLMRRGKRF